MARSSLAPAPSKGSASEPPPLDRIHQVLATAPSDQPLPTTRELGERLHIAHTTAFRLLRELATAGAVWQHPVNGRYYPAAARSLFDRPKPVACLFRRLELASELYRELLEGVSAGCGAHQRMMALWHDEGLLNHPDPQEPPIFAPVPQQRAILRNFASRHSAGAGGFILDHIWSDEALAAEFAALRPAVVLYRSTTLPDVSNIRADLRSGAFKALAHLLGRGFERIVPVVPFEGDPAVQEFGAVLDAVATELDCRACLAPPVIASRSADRAGLLQRVERGQRRCAILCPEDNIAIMLLTAGRAAGLSCPKDFGVLSVMGTDLATRAGVTCLRYDFRKLGRLAVDALDAAAPVRETLEPSLVPGSST